MISFSQYRQTGVVKMKKRMCFTVDEDVIEGLRLVPRGVSLSTVVTWVLRAMAEDVKPNGMTEDEFIKYMDSDPEGRAVREYLGEKLGPILKKISRKKK